MHLPTPTILTEFMMRCRACLGICRHCLAATSPAEACHDSLPDVILALEVATIMLETGHERALDQLRHCAEACAFSAANWEAYAHPLSRQSAEFCRQLYEYWCARTDDLQGLRLA